MCVLSSWGYTSHPTHLKTRRGRCNIYKGFEKFTSIFPGWVESVQSCWKLRNSIWMVILFAIVRRIFDGDVDPPKSREGNSLRVLWSELRVSLLPTQKAMGSQSIYWKFTVFDVWKISSELIYKAVEQNQFDSMILSDIREALDWTLNWNGGFWGDHVPIQQNGNQFCSTQSINRDRWGPIMVFGNTAKGWGPYCHNHTWDLLEQQDVNFNGKDRTIHGNFSLLIDRWVRQISVNFEKESHVFEWLVSWRCEQRASKGNEQFLSRSGFSDYPLIYQKLVLLHPQR